MMKKSAINKTGTTQSSATTIYDLPKDLLLNIANHLSIQDAKLFGKYVYKEMSVRNHLLTDEYIIHYLKNPLIYEIYKFLFQTTIENVKDLIVRSAQAQLKPVRYSMDNGILYTDNLYLLQRYFIVSDIKVPSLTDKSFTFFFQNTVSNTTEVYYEGIDMYFKIVDDPNTKTRHIFIRVPYECDDYVYGFAVLMLRFFVTILKCYSLSSTWKLHCSYLLCNNIETETLVRPVISVYNTRNVDKMRHKFLHRLIEFVLQKSGCTFVVQPWNMNENLIDRAEQSMLVKYSRDIVTDKDTMLENIGLPTYENGYITNVYLDVEEQTYIQWTNAEVTE